MLKYTSYSDKIHRSNFVKQHSETVMVRNYQNADCGLKNKFSESFTIIVGTVLFRIVSVTHHHIPQTMFVNSSDCDVVPVNHVRFWRADKQHTAANNQPLSVLQLVPCQVLRAVVNVSNCFPLTASNPWSPPPHSTTHGSPGPRNY